MNVVHPFSISINSSFVLMLKGAPRSRVNLFSQEVSLLD